MSVKLSWFSVTLFFGVQQLVESLLFRSRGSFNEPPLQRRIGIFSGCVDKVPNFLSDFGLKRANNVGVFCVLRCDAPCRKLGFNLREPKGWIAWPVRRKFDANRQGYWCCRGWFDRAGGRCRLGLLRCRILCNLFNSRRGHQFSAGILLIEM